MRRSVGANKQELQLLNGQAHVAATCLAELPQRLLQRHCQGATCSHSRLRAGGRRWPFRQVLKNKTTDVAVRTWYFWHLYCVVSF
jgi:hypothetical protein